ncbi:MAG: hypothetical protein R3F42_08495 [Pseudomonadota bacterium]
MLALNTYGKPGAENGNYLQDFAALYTTLAALLQDSNGFVAEPATAVTKVLALMQGTGGIKPVSESAAVKGALEKIIGGSSNDVVRGRAIDAWVQMYPPDDAMMGSLEQILQGDMIQYPASHAAAFRAYGIYRRRYNYELPKSTAATAKHLLEHPSQDVRVKAEYALAEISGAAALPTLITQLEHTAAGSESRVLTALILRLDNSQDTLDKLNRIGTQNRVSAALPANDDHTDSSNTDQRRH